MSRVRFAADFFRGLSAVGLALSLFIAVCVLLAVIGHAVNRALGVSAPGPAGSLFDGIATMALLAFSAAVLRSAVIFTALLGKRLRERGWR